MIFEYVNVVHDAIDNNDMIHIIFFTPQQNRDVFMFLLLFVCLCVCVYVCVCVCVCLCVCVSVCL